MKLDFTDTEHSNPTELQKQTCHTKTEELHLRYQNNMKEAIITYNFTQKEFNEELQLIII